MAGEVLSHDEVEALVAAAKEGRLPAEQDEPRQRRSRRVREIDFTRPSKFTQDQQRRLERAHEGFCRRASTKLSAELRTPIELELLDAKQLSWSAALTEIPQASLLAVVGIDPLGTRVLLTAELDFVMRTIELLLGGSGEGKTVRRDLTDIESALSRRIFEMIVEPLSLAWQETADLRLSLVEVELQTTTVQLAPLSEPSLALTFEVRHARSSSTLTLAVPYRSVQAAIGRIGAHRYDDSADDRVTAAEAMAGALEQVEVEVRAEAGAVELSLAQLVALEPGSILPLGAGSQPLLLIGERPLHRVRPGRAGASRAVQVLEAVEEATE